MNKKGQVGFRNNEAKKLYFKEIFENFFTERFDEIKALRDETNFDDLI